MAYKMMKVNKIKKLLRERGRFFWFRVLAFIAVGACPCFQRTQNLQTPHTFSAFDFVKPGRTAFHFDFLPQCFSVLLCLYAGAGLRIVRDEQWVFYKEAQKRLIFVFCTYGTLFRKPLNTQHFKNEPH